MASALVVGTNSYISLADATTYLVDSVNGYTWEFLDPETQTRALHTAFRLLEKQKWGGTSVGGTPFFPAAGVTDCYGDPVDDATVPQAIIDAQAELAFALTEDGELETNANTGSSIKSLKAGSAQLEFFNRDGSTDYAVTRFPANVMELIRCYLEGQGGAGPEAIGADGESIFDECDDYDRNRPF